MWTDRVVALRWLAGLVRPHRLRLAVASLAVALASAVALVLPSVAGHVVDAALVDHSRDSVDAIVGALLALFAIAGVLEFVQSYSVRSLAALILAALRTRLHAHLLTLSPAFHETRRTGELLSRLSSDVERLDDALSYQLASGLENVLVLFGAIVLLALLSPGLTALMLVAVPPVAIAADVFGLKLEKLSAAEQEALADANVVAEETISGIRTVQACAREAAETARYAGHLARAVELMLRAARAWGAYAGIVTVASQATLAIVLWRGASLVVAGELSAGRLTTFLLYTLVVAHAAGSLSALYGGLTSAAGATARLREVLDVRPAIVDAPDALPLARTRGHLELIDVSFEYPSGEGRRALSRVTLDARPGTTLAVIGPSGAGKSTLASLLLRFHDPNEGRVLLDGTDVRRYRLADLRRAIGAVPQEPFLFGGSIAENIRYARPEATDEEVRRAAEAAHVHRFVARLPRGYATTVGERGVKLSAGERQRIAIARVFLQSPGLVILDEATSALDGESEHLIQGAFERLLDGRTVVVIAHRLATVRRADRVVVLEHGAVVEAGTQDELIRSGGFYRRVCELQLVQTPVQRASAATVSTATRATAAA